MASYFDDIHHQPMVCTLFPSNSIQTSTGLQPSRFYFTHGSSDDIELAFELTNAVNGGRQAELKELLSWGFAEAQIKPSERIHLPFEIWNTSLLYSAANGGSVSMVRALIYEFQHDLVRGNHFGTSPLEIASMRNHGEVVYELMLNGANLSMECITSAAQWNAFSSLNAMYCAGELQTKEELDFVMSVAKYYNHSESIDMIAKLEEVSPVEAAADAMNLTALRCMYERKPGSKVVPTIVEWRKALVALNKSKMKLVRSLKEFRDCKETIIQAQKKLVDLSTALLRLHIVQEKRVMLGVEAPKALHLLFEFLGLIAIAGTDRKPVTNSHKLIMIGSPESLV